MTHPILAEHPSLQALAEEASAIAAADARFKERFREEERRYERERREHTVALRRGELDHPEPAPVPNVSAAAMSLMDRRRKLEERRRDAIRRAADELLAALAARERELLREVAPATAVLDDAAQEARALVDARLQVQRLLRPGAPRDAERTRCEPEDVLRASLDGSDVLPTSLSGGTGYAELPSRV